MDLETKYDDLAGGENKGKKAGVESTGRRGYFPDRIQRERIHTLLRIAEHLDWLSRPLRVKLLDGSAKGKSPGKLSQIFVFFRHHVAFRRFLCRHAGLIHLFRLFSNIVKHSSIEGDAFLAAGSAVAGNEQSVLIEGCEGGQRRAP